jgi:pilus assembly protein TadC
VTLLAVVLAAASVWVLVEGHPMGVMTLVPGGERRPRSERLRRRSHHRLDRMTAAALTFGIGAGAVIGGPVGLVVGLVGGLVCSALLHRIEPAPLRREREQLAADLPLAVDLLAACLTAGRPPAESLRAVAAAVEGPVAARLAYVSGQLALGADPVSVWRQLETIEALAPLGRTMVRAIESGAPVADGLSRLVDELRLARRWSANERARSVGVKAAMPLGLCFLPAFICVGIIPTIASSLLQLLP